MDLEDGLAPFHPGWFLVEYLNDKEQSHVEFAGLAGVLPDELLLFLMEKTPVTIDLASRIGDATGTTPGYWLNLQKIYDDRRRRDG